MIGLRSIISNAMVLQWALIFSLASARSMG